MVVNSQYTWHLLSANAFQKSEKGGERGHFVPCADGGYWQGGSKYPVHIVFPMIHGRFGEDGALPGLCEALNIPYVGSGILGSSVCWDKAFTKNILKAFNIPFVPFLSYKSISRIPSYQDACSLLKKTDLVIKPAMQGSSIGVVMVSDDASYKKEVSNVMSCFSKVMIEPRIDGDEIECAILDDFGARASELGQILLPRGSFYSYEEKYDSDSRTKTFFPEHLSSYTKKNIQKTALQCFYALECRGMARVDFFVTKKKSIMVNEVNTIPGFTSISLYPKMWEKSGIQTSRLVQALIDEGLKSWHSRKFYAQKEERICLLS